MRFHASDGLDGIDQGQAWEEEGYQALFSHTLIHALGTLIIILVFAPNLWWLSLVDFVIHSIVDRLKGIATLKNGWQTKDTMFWWAFGADQELHNFTHIAYVALIFMDLGGVFL
ncbi:MAG: DUF3307 domain-containing protein [Alphaproteobacteria bacterium]